MLHIRLCSDLHLEFTYDTYDRPGQHAKEQLNVLLPPLPSDKKTVLVIAGDLATAIRAGRIANFLSMVVPRFKHVIYVLGNHEHYGCHIDLSETLIREALEPHNFGDRLTIAGNSVQVIKVKDVTFYCTTMWTDYNHGSPTSAMIVERFIADHRAIRCGEDAHFRVANAALLHAKLRNELIVQMTGEKDHSKSVVVTHHMPTYEAVHPMYKQDEPALTLNAAFAANMDDVIEQFQPAFWMFGHTHTSYDAMRGNTRLLCNPGGYPNEHNLNTGTYRPWEVYTL